MSEIIPSINDQSQPADVYQSLLGKIFETFDRGRAQAIQLHRNSCYKSYLPWQNYLQELQLIPSNVVVIPALEV